MSSNVKLVITFLCGLLLGGAGVGFGLHCYIAHKVDHNNDPQHILDRLSKELDLNTEQKDRVSALLKQNDLVDALERVQAMRDDERCAILHEVFEG